MSLSNVLGNLIAEVKGENMSELDKKLKNLDLEFLVGVPVHLSNSMVEQIKQVFIDDGWVDTGISNTVKDQIQLYNRKEWEAKAIKDGWAMPDSAKKEKGVE